ncbi:hypothetical protein, partial [Mesorhizobium sp. A556]
DDLFRTVSLSGHFLSPPSAQKPYIREDHFSGGRPLLSKSQSRPDEGVWKLLASHYGNAARVAAAMGTEKQVNQQQPTPLPKIHLD